MKLVITSGEPAGIGPDICIKALKNQQLDQIINQNQITLLGNKSIFTERANILDIDFEKIIHKVNFFDLPILAKVNPGEIALINQIYVLLQIDLAINFCLYQGFDALVTAPIQKSAIISAGMSNFTGHTEYLAFRTDTRLSVMMLASDNLKVVPLTTHIPISKLPFNITQDLIINTLNLLEQELKAKYRIQQPTIGVLGLNPHAGDSGKIGDEEFKTIAPAIEKFKANSKAKIIGPISADTAFLEKTQKQVDVYLGMYHDQVLPVFKTLTFGHAVNTTLGLPFIRTSVDHGTALNLAATKYADEQGMITAIIHAINLQNN